MGRGWLPDVINSVTDLKGKFELSAGVGQDKEGIKKIAVDGAKLCKELVSTLPETRSPLNTHLSPTPALSSNLPLRSVTLLMTSGSQPRPIRALLISQQLLR